MEALEEIFTMNTAVAGNGRSIQGALLSVIGVLETLISYDCQQLILANLGVIG